jgi:selenocysteine-specific elongation factor
LTGLAEKTVTQALERLVTDGDVARVGEQYAGQRYWQLIADRAATVLRQFHHDNPLRQGMTREELRRRLHRGREDWPAWLDALAARDVVEEVGTLVALRGFRSSVDDRREERKRVLAVLSRSPVSPPTSGELEALADTDGSMLAHMAEAGDIVHVGGGVYFAAGPYSRLVAIALELIDRNGSVSMADFRDAAGTTRKYAQALLEHLDSRRITRRQGDVRVRGREAPTCV